MSMYPVFFAILFCLFGWSSGSLKSDAAEQVLAIVNSAEKYNKDIIPFPNKSGPLPVKVTMFLRSLDIDDVHMKLNADLTFRMQWEDSRLRYSVEGVPQVRFSDVTKFWIPDAFFKDSHMTEQMKSVHPEAYIQIDRKGSVLYSTRFRMELQCPMDLRRFPHDVQTCIISFASYGFSKKDIDFTFEDEAIKAKPDLIVSSARFSIASLETESCDSVTRTGSYSCLQVMVTVERKFANYLLEWYIPCMCFVVIAFVSEFLQPSCLLPRLVLTVGPLLTLAASSLNYQSSLASVPYTTAFDVFTGTSLLIIFATVIHVVISYYYDQKPAEEEKPESEDVEANKSAWKKLYKKVRQRGNYVTRAAIIGLYCAFIFLYFLAYSL